MNNTVLLALVSSLPAGLTAERRAAGGGLEERIMVRRGAQLLAVAGEVEGTFAVTYAAKAPKALVSKFENAVRAATAGALIVWVAA